MTSPDAEPARSRPARRLLAALAGAALLLGGLVALGRAERTSWVDDEVRGMRQTLALIGPLDSDGLSGYRVLSGFDCLTYRRGANLFALEVCVDPQGQVVETIDRRRFERSIHSVRAQPARSTLVVERRLVDRLLRRMGAASVLADDE